MKNHGSLEGIVEQASLKLSEAATDFHLLQTEVRRKKEEVGNHERILSSTSWLSSSIEKLLIAELSFSSNFLFRLVIEAGHSSLSSILGISEKTLQKERGKFVTYGSKFIYTNIYT